MSEEAKRGAWGPLSPRHQTAAAAITLACLVIMAISWVWGYYRRGRTIDIDRPFQVEEIQLRIDVNRAAWPELTLLPDISETMARRIVAYRDQHGPFTELHQIQRVKGIGPRTLSRIEQYLLPIPLEPIPLEPIP